MRAVVSIEIVINDSVGGNTLCVSSIADKLNSEEFKTQLCSVEQIDFYKATVSEV